MTTNTPDERTSNYGWALWHLQEAGKAQSILQADAHALCAQARATLALVDEQCAARGGAMPEKSVWEVGSDA